MRDVDRALRAPNQLADVPYLGLEESLRRWRSPFVSGMLLLFAVFGDPGPAWSQFELVATLEADGAPVQAIDFSPDGKHLVAIDRAGELFVWSLSDDISGTVAAGASPLGDDPPVTAFRISADSRKLAVGHQDGSLSLFDLTTRRRLHRNADGPRLPIDQIAIDGDVVTATDGIQFLLRWQVKSNERQMRRVHRWTRISALESKRATLRWQSTGRAAWRSGPSTGRIDRRGFSAC